MRTTQLEAVYSRYTFVIQSINYKGVTTAGSTMHSGSVKRKNFHSMINDTVIVVKVLNDAPA